MRDIKFRAWDREENRMIHWGELTYNGDEDIYGGWWIMSAFETDTTVFQEYTGLKDKNGKEIYENDVVEFYDFWDEISGGRSNGKTRTGVVGYLGSGFRVRNNKDDYEEDLFLLKINDDELKVIGNIYEHPHLLEVNE